MDFVTWDPILLALTNGRRLQTIRGQEERGANVLFLSLPSCFFVVLATAVSFYNHHFCLVAPVW